MTHAPTRSIANTQPAPGHPGALRSWWQEPLLHFIVLGAALFAVHRWVAPPAHSNQILLSESVIRGLRQDHLRRTGALPAAQEEAALIQRFIDDEVLYREAVAQGLDRGDIIVRRRLVQKMEFVIENSEPIAEPTDAALHAYLDAHRDRYATAPRVALVQVFVGADRHAEAAPQVAAHLRDALATGTDPSTLGEPFLRGREFPLHSARELAAIFGPSFAVQVMTLPAGVWSEPVPSSYGLHLVRITERQAEHVPDLAEVRAAVVRDWQEEQRAGASRSAINRLRQRYDIRIESPQMAARAPEFRVQ